MLYYNSDGRLIAKRLSECLSIPFYDKEIIQAAGQSHISKEFFFDADQHGAGSLERLAATFMVSTHYRHRMNSGMQATEIFGMAFACLDGAGRLKWKRDISDCPERLSGVPTMKGPDAGAPIP